MKTNVSIRARSYTIALTIVQALAIGAVATSTVPAMAQAAPQAVGSLIVPDFADIVEKTGDAVVNIRTTEKARSPQGMPGGSDEEMQEFFRRFFGVPMPGQPQEPQPDRPPRGGQRPPLPQQDDVVPRGVGSGFIISSDGYVLTNAHVVEGANEVYVTLNDKREYKAKIIGSDIRTDVALVKIEGSNLPRLNMGDSNKIRVGEWVVAIGSPFGLDNTVTAGIVSAKSRDTGDYLPLIQTDVAVNPGNSGGPLINMRGEVIGINSQIYSRSGGYMGISFAVPIDEAMRVADALKTTGRVIRGRIGVQIGEVTKDVAESLGLEKAQGALVQRVEPASPAEKAGLEAGDIIIKYNGNAIEKSSDLPRQVGRTKPGTEATVTVWRKGASRQLPITVAELETERTAKPAEQKPEEKQPANALGLTVAPLTETQKKELRIENGVVVEEVEGVAARAGLRPGDVIQRLNNTDVTGVSQFNNLVSKLEPKKPAVLLVRRGEASQFVPIRPQQ